MEPVIVETTYAALQSYQIGQKQGIKTGIAIGVVGMLLIKTARARYNDRRLINKAKKNNK